MKGRASVDILQEIQGIIATTLAVPAAQVHAESKASDFSEWDSVHHLLLVMEIEQKFTFKVPLEEIAQLDSVDAILKAVQKRVAA
jgi:acyl carrier protein